MIYDYIRIIYAWKHLRKCSSRGFSFISKVHRELIHFLVEADGSRYTEAGADRKESPYINSSLCFSLRCIRSSYMKIKKSLVLFFIAVIVPSTRISRFTFFYTTTFSMSRQTEKKEEVEKKKTMKLLLSMYNHEVELSRQYAARHAEEDTIPCTFYYLKYHLFYRTDINLYG